VSRRDRDGQEHAAEPPGILEISSEFRRSLTAIRGALGLLESGHMGGMSGEAMKMVAVARSSADDLIRLMSNLVEAERIQTGQVELPLETIEARDLVSLAMAVSAGQAAEAGVSLVLDSVPDCAIAGNQDRLVQVLSYLTGSVITDTVRGGVVRLSVSAEGGRVRFTVSSSQRHRSIDPRPSGWAISEYIAGAVVKMHGGRLWNDRDKPADRNAMLELPGKKAQTTDRGSPARIRVLLVEDEDQLCRYISIFLGREGYDVCRAATIEQARLLVRTFQPSIVLCDIHLPDGNGIELLHDLRRLPGFGQVPFLVLTGRDLAAYDRRLPAATNWIMKPFGHIELLAALKKLPVL